MRLRYVLTLIVLTLLVILAGCSRTGQDSAQPDPSSPADRSQEGQPRRELPTDRTVDVDYANPDDVISALCRIVYSRDAGTEERYSDSYRRALGLMTPGMAKQFRSPPNIRPLPQWVRWQRDDAQIEGSCRIVPSVAAPDTDRSVTRLVYATQVVYRGDGTTETLRPAVIYSTADKVGDRWLVSSFDVQDFG